MKQAIIQKLSFPRRSRYLRLYRYAVAACIMVAAGLGIYNLSQPGKTESSRRVSVVPPTGYPRDVRDSIAVNRDTMAVVRPEAPVSSSVAEKGLLSLSLDLDGEKSPLTGNNLLTTLTSYEYPAMKSLLGKPHNEKGRARSCK